MGFFFFYCIFRLPPEQFKCNVYNRDDASSWDTAAPVRPVGLTQSQLWSVVAVVWANEPVNEEGALCLSAYILNILEKEKMQNFKHTRICILAGFPSHWHVFWETVLQSKRFKCCESFSGCWVWDWLCRQHRGALVSSLTRMKWNYCA